MERGRRITRECKEERGTEDKGEGGEREGRRVLSKNGEREKDEKGVQREWGDGRRGRRRRKGGKRAS